MDITTIQKKLKKIDYRNTFYQWDKTSDLAIFFPINENLKDNQEAAFDDLMNHFAFDDFQHFNAITKFIPDEPTYNAITIAIYKANEVQARAALKQVFENNAYEKDGYFFTFLPKKIK